MSGILRPVLLVISALVIIGLVGRRMARGDRKVDAYYAALRVDLRSVVRAQAGYYAARHRYAPVLDSLAVAPFGGVHMGPSEGVQITITRADEYSWEAVGTHTLLATRCVYGDSAPPRPIPSFSAFRDYCTSPP